MTDDLVKRERRMDAYYYGFNATGVDAIDKVLSAVACAGKAYHHTQCWRDDTGWAYDDHTGETPVDWIQNAAKEAADRIEQLEAECEQWKAGFQVADEKWSKISARCEALEAALRVAAGYISTKEGHTDQHPQDVYDWIVSAALGEKKDD